MTERPRQLVLDLPVRSALGADDLLVTPSNQAAVDLVDIWPKWPAPALMLTGSRGVGKTHLAAVWRETANADTVAYSDLREDAVDRFVEAKAVVVEDVHHQGPERVLFHLLNAARERGGSILITSRFPAGALEIELPDLRSRLRALPAVALKEPDDTLLQGLLVKLFADRQIAVDPGIIGYLLKSMERSAEAAQDIVAAVDHAALSDRRRVTRALVAEVLRRSQEPDGQGLRALKS